jgi:hypothetical protein
MQFCMYLASALQREVCMRHFASTATTCRSVVLIKIVSVPLG